MLKLWDARYFSSLESASLAANKYAFLLKERKEKGNEGNSAILFRIRVNFENNVQNNIWNYRLIADADRCALP